MRKGLTIEQLGDLLQQPFNATLATYRRDGSVLLSPVWYEWRDGGFSIITSPDDVKVRHIERAGRASVVVSDNEVIRLETVDLRTWDFADGAATFGAA